MYIDETIIYSATPEQHLHDLGVVLRLLNTSGVTLNLSKCDFAQPSVRLLGHTVSRLGLSTPEERAKAIRTLAFPTNLQQLETGLGSFGYYQKFCPFFAHLAAPLQELKTKGFKGAPVMRHARVNFAAKVDI